MSTTFDLIFAGGGSAACITAGRLAAADPSLKILVLEAGPHVDNFKNVVQPGRWPGNLDNPALMHFYQSQPSESLANRALALSTGKAVGGGSAINAMMYTRASASDYDEWQEHGNPGWGSAQLIPLLRRAETWQEPTQNETHGTSGPLKVSYAKGSNNVGLDLLEVSVQYDGARGYTEDTNDFSSVDQYGRWARYINKETGRRSDTANHYIYNQKHNPNLVVVPHKRVLRVTFENQTAVGVEYVDEQTTTNGTPRPISIARAKKIVLAAGTFGSPAILERSGIGKSDLLDSLKIPRIVDLPGVGEHYRDHVAAFVPYYTSDEVDTLDPITFGTPNQVEVYEKEWAACGTGLLAANIADFGIKIKPSKQDLQALSPAFDNVWNDFFKSKADRAPMLIASLARYIGQDPAVQGKKVVSIGCIALYRVSVGSSHITSGIDAYAQPKIKTGFLEDMTDVVLLRWAYKKSRELIRRSKFYRGEVASGHPAFSHDSAAVAVEGALPVSVDAPDIVYTQKDDDAIDAYLRANVQSSLHALGTCSMKPREQGGVVDPRLNVYGVQGLKVADLSVLPVNVGANTYNTAIAVGEKAAVILAEELGIKLL